MHLDEEVELDASPVPVPSTSPPSPPPNPASPADGAPNSSTSKPAAVQKQKEECTHTGKLLAITAACRQATKSGNMASLSQLATSTGGLVNDEARRIAWPLLLRSKATALDRSDNEPLWRSLARHRDEDQVKLDVNRSFIYYPTGESDKELDRRKEDLSDVITAVLRRHPMLCYFQGFHDIVQVLLLVLGKRLAVDAVAHLSLVRIRDFMLPSLSPSLTHLKLLPAILYSVDPKLCQHLSQTKPFFALAATLTLYAHEIQDYGVIARLFDFLLAKEAAVSIYFFAVIILSRRAELFEIPADEPEMLHFTLSKLPQYLDIESLIREAEALFDSHPPESLPFRAWSQVSAYSVLKTTRDPASAQTLEAGEVLFKMQLRQMERHAFQQRLLGSMWRYRRPIGSVSFAILIGLASIWVRKTGHDVTISSWLYSILGAFQSLRSRL